MRYFLQGSKPIRAHRYLDEDARARGEAERAWKSMRRRDIGALFPAKLSEGDIDAHYRSQRDGGGARAERAKK
jgi:hypothetical protein